MLNPNMAVNAFPQAILSRIIPTGPTAFDMRQMSLIPRNVFTTILAPALITLKYFPSKRFHCLAF